MALAESQQPKTNTAGRTHRARRSAEGLMAKKVKKIRKNVVRGIAHVKATQNNTLVTITDMNGETVCWDSAGTIGFKGARKSTPFAATRAGESAGQKARKVGMS